MRSQQQVIAGTVTLALTNAVGAQPPVQPGQGQFNNPYGAPSPMIDPDAEGLTVAPPNFGVPPGPIPPRPLRRRDLSWIYIDRPRPRKLAVHDIITVIVD